MTLTEQQEQSIKEEAEKAVPGYIFLMDIAAAKKYQEQINKLLEVLNIGQAELRAMYKLRGIIGSNVLDLMDNTLTNFNESLKG